MRYRYWIFVSVPSIGPVVSCPLRVNKVTQEGCEAQPKQQVAWRAQEDSACILRETGTKGIIREPEVHSSKSNMDTLRGSQE